jgi:hypothetical protein
MNSPEKDATAAWLAQAIRPEDTLFRDSPDTGTAACLCSRCGQVVKFSRGGAVRVWPESGGEYRYCLPCLGLNTR